jgi:hypothetical protein
LDQGLRRRPPPIADGDALPHARERGVEEDVGYVPGIDRGDGAPFAAVRLCDGAAREDDDGAKSGCELHEEFLWACMA